MTLYCVCVLCSGSGGYHGPSSRSLLGSVSFDDDISSAGCDIIACHTSQSSLHVSFLSLTVPIPNIHANVCPRPLLPPQAFMLTANINPVDNSNHSHGRCSTANNACTTISTVTPQWSSPLPQYYRVLHFRYCGLPVVTEVLPLYPLPCRSVVSHLQMCYCRLAQSLFRFQWSNAGSSQVQRQQSVKLTGLVIDSLTD